MGFDMFALFAIGLAIAGVSVLRQVWRARRAIFDDDFTAEDRAHVNQIALFVLLPISVALHELGHAIAVWSFGAEVVDFGFYFFAGFVSYQGFLTDTQQIVIAAAGTAVNILLATAAMATVLLKRPPLRAPWNELLVQFSILTIVNALIFYPALDLLSGMNADFRQMYFGGVPWLSAIIFVVHAGTLAGGYLLFTRERTGTRLSTLTGLPPHVRRSFFGGFKASTKTGAGGAASAQLTPREAGLRSAIERVGSGWHTRVTPAIVRGPDGAFAGIVRWDSESGPRSVSVVEQPNGAARVIVPWRTSTNAADALTGRVTQTWPSAPSEDQLVIAIRIAMEQADGAPAPARAGA